MSGTAKDQTNRTTGLNEVKLVGRVSAPAQLRVMPSGDELVSFRLIVDRSPSAKSPSERSRPTVDVIDVACWSARSRRTALNLEAGQIVTVQGALRRRFWKAGPAAMSRCEVEASSVAKGRPARSTD